MVTLLHLAREREREREYNDAKSPAAVNDSQIRHALSSMNILHRGVDYSGDVSLTFYKKYIRLPHFFIGQLCSRHVEVLMEQCILMQNYLHFKNTR